MPYKTTAKILVTRTGAVGDTILLSPVLQNLRAADPGAAIHLLGHPERVRLLLGPPNADAVISSEDSRWVSLHRAGHPGSEAARWLSGYDLALVYSSRPDEPVERNLQAILGERLVRHPALPPGGYRNHYTEFLLEPLGERGYPVRMLPPVISAGYARPVEHGIEPGFFVIHPGAGAARKRWPLENFLSLASALEAKTGLGCRFLLGPADQDLEIPIGQGGGGTVSDLSLEKVAALLRSAKGYAGNDSGITHLAAALGVPTVSVFTGSDPAVWRPLGRSVKVIDARHPASAGTAARTVLEFLASKTVCD